MRSRAARAARASATSGSSVSPTTRRPFGRCAIGREPGDLILFKGSRMYRLEEIVRALRDGG